MAETRRFRGISKRLAVQYLENLGGERVEGAEASDSDAARVAADADGEPGDEDGPVCLEGDGWAAAVSAETVEAAGSIELTEVTVEFDGEDETLEPVVEAFARKAMRAGG